MQACECFPILVQVDIFLTRARYSFIRLNNHFCNTNISRWSDSSWWLCSFQQARRRRTFRVWRGTCYSVVYFNVFTILFLLVCIKESINFPAIKSFQHCFGVLIFSLHFVFLFRYLYTNAFIPLNIVLVASPILRRIYDYGH